MAVLERVEKEVAVADPAPEPVAVTNTDLAPDAVAEPAPDPDAVLDRVVKAVEVAEPAPDPEAVLIRVLKEAVAAVPAPAPVAVLCTVAGPVGVCLSSSNSDIYVTADSVDRRTTEETWSTNRVEKFGYPTHSSARSIPLLLVA